MAYQRVKIGSQISKLANAGAQGTAVALDLNVLYTTTSDGYVVIAGGASAGSAVVVAVCDKNGASMFSIFEVTPVNNGGSCSAMYVKKGTKLKTTRIDSGTSAIFHPFSY